VLLRRQALEDIRRHLDYLRAALGQCPRKLAPKRAGQQIGRDDAELDCGLLLGGRRH
jgi:hypothetical protein